MFPTISLSPSHRSRFASYLALAVSPVPSSLSLSLSRRYPSSLCSRPFTGITTIFIRSPRKFGWGSSPAKQYNCSCIPPSVTQYNWGQQVCTIGRDSYSAKQYNCSCIPPRITQYNWGGKATTIG